MNLVFADEVTDSGVGHHDLHAHGASLAIRISQQALAHDAFQHQRQLRANLRLLVCREDVDNSVDG